MSKFGELISAEVPVLFNFFTTWNEDSQAMHPLIKDVAAVMGDHAKFIKIDVDKNPEITEALRIKGLPTFILYKNGEMKWRESGVQDVNTLVHIIQKHI